MQRHFIVALDNEFNNYMKSVYHNLDNAAECDIRLFWNLVKRQKNRTSRTFPEIRDDNGNNDPSGVAEAFIIYYENIYSLSDHDLFDDAFRCRVETKFSPIEKDCSELKGEIPGGPFTIDELLPIIWNLKRRKAPGPDQITY